MKQTYLVPEMELLILANEDVISTSLQAGGAGTHSGLTEISYDDFVGDLFN